MIMPLGYWASTAPMSTSDRTSRGGEVSRTSAGGKLCRAYASLAASRIAGWLGELARIMGNGRLMEGETVRGKPTGSTTAAAAALSGVPGEERLWLWGELLGEGFGEGFGETLLDDSEVPNVTDEFDLVLGVAEIMGAGETERCVSCSDSEMNCSVCNAP